MRVVRTENIEEDSLGSKYQSPKENTWLLDRHERHEVHALILRFFEESVDPSGIAPL